MRPFVRGSMPAFIAFMYSMFMSFTVGAESFIVNCGCCAAALVAKTSAASAGPMVFMRSLLLDRAAIMPDYWPRKSRTPASEISGTYVMSTSAMRYRKMKGMMPR